ncbi:GspE/PulE family protein [Patescibacteria group bacterium]|nr:GspE/PulE family protein [Patescibacteria group bacterium]MBU1868541.1 GspE/PulE family protein [Patescibacteria group bacterium]
MAERLTVEDVLKDLGVITDEQLSVVKLEQINTGKSIEDIVKEHAWATEIEIYQAKADLLGVPFIAVPEVEVDREVLSLIPEGVARQYVLIPLSKKGDVVKVAMEDPLDLQVKEFLEAKTGLKIEPNLAIPTEIVAAIDEAYSGGMESEVRAALKETEEEISQIKVEIASLEDIEKDIKKAPVARIVSTVLQYAVKSRASDVHIEPQAKRTRVRYRIDGILRERLSLPRQVHASLVSRIKILSNLKIDETRIPQDGRFMIHVDKLEIDLRVSTLPTAHGEKVVMRLLKKDTNVPTLSELGLRGRALKNVEESLKKTRGIVLVAGPTGSGKTTTLRTSIEMVSTTQINVITLEDPVEYEMKGINQVHINPQAGLTFASGLRSILRQDPDVIMVGEIRDDETMKLAIQAALTGHLVFSTVHTNSAAGTIPRLLDMGAEPFLLSSTVETIIAQRLVRVLCKKCREEYHWDGALRDQFQETLGSLLPQKDQEKIVLFKAVGCPECNMGYVSRVGIFEVLMVDERVAQQILRSETSDAIEKEAVKNGMVTMLQDGFLKVIEGITTIEEVLRVAQE